MIKRQPGDAQSESPTAAADGAPSPAGTGILATLDQLRQEGSETRSRVERLEEALHKQGVETRTQVERLEEALHKTGDETRVQIEQVRDLLRQQGEDGSSERRHLLEAVRQQSDAARSEVLALLEGVRDEVASNRARMEQSDTARRDEISRLRSQMELVLEAVRGTSSDERAVVQESREILQRLSVASGAQMTELRRLRDSVIGGMVTLDQDMVHAMVQQDDTIKHVVERVEMLARDLPDYSHEVHRGIERAFSDLTAALRHLERDNANRIAELIQGALSQPRRERALPAPGHGPRIPDYNS